MWIFQISTGKLRQDEGEVVAIGYSGHGEGKNNPDMISVHDVGPIPIGDWTIEGPPMDTKSHGPYVLRLTPKPGTEVYGRSGFLNHGDSAHHPGEASLGCMITPRTIREQVWNSGDRDLRVIA